MTKNMTKRLAILDRDGVIDDNSQCYYVYRREDFKFNPGVLEAIAALHEAGYTMAIVSNQSGIAKGQYTLGDIRILHQWMCGEIEKAGGHISPHRIYICPHHPKVTNCLCRKPKPLLLQKAMAEAGVSDPGDCIFIGDSPTDVEAGNAAGIKTYKVEPNGNLYTQLKNYNII